MNRKLQLTLWLMLASACQDSVNRFPVDAGPGGGAGGASGGGEGSVGGGSGGAMGGGGGSGGGAGGGSGGGSAGGGGSTGGGGGAAGGGGGASGGGSGGMPKADDVISGAGRVTGGTFVMDAQVGQGTPQAPATGGGRVIQGNTAIKR